MLNPYRKLRDFFESRRRDRIVKMACKMSQKLSPLESGEISQWVSTVTSFSSEYDAQSWSHQTVIGPPRVYPQYGDTAGSWAQGDVDANQFIELEYDQAVFITRIEIYETYNSGGVKAILGKNQNGQWVELYSTDQVTNHYTSRIFSPELKNLGCPCREIRLNIDCTACNSWVEIDAVKLIGKLYHTELPPSISVLADNLRSMVNNKQFSDVSFQVDGKLVYAHKVILCARSAFFRAMFTPNTKESSKELGEPVELKDVSYEDLFCVLHYLYTNDIPTDVSCQGLPDICRVADRFNIEGLMVLATYLVSEMLDETNVVDTYVSAASKQPVLDNIKENCLFFISSNLQSVVRTAAFERLPQDLMLEIIQASTSKLAIK